MDREKRSRLGFRLVGVSLLGLVLAFGVFYLVYGVLVPRVLASERVTACLRDRERERVALYQEKVREQGMTIQDVLGDQSAAIAGAEPDVYTIVMGFPEELGEELEETVSYSSMQLEVPEDAPPAVLGGSYAFPLDLYRLECADGELYIALSPNTLWLESLGRIAALVLALTGFCAVVVPYIWRLLGRIADLSRETEVLMGGDLDHSIRAPGGDELSRLGENVERLRLSVVERIEREREAVGANSRLITGISHDLRTPLTKLMGYLEILNSRRYQTEAQRDTFLRLAAEKAEQIKSMTDQLFASAQVECCGETLAAPPERVDGAALLGQILSELCGDLQREGFPAAEPPDFREPFSLYLRTEDVLRVFDNLFTNLCRYADRAAPVTLRVEQSPGAVTVYLENRVAPVPERRDSHGVGLPTARELMERWGGRLETERAGDVYRCALTFAL